MAVRGALLLGRAVAARARAGGSGATSERERTESSDFIVDILAGTAIGLLRMGDPEPSAWKCEYCWWMGA